MKIIGGLDRAEKLNDHVDSPEGIEACVLSFAANETQYACNKTATRINYWNK